MQAFRPHFEFFHHYEVVGIAKAQIEVNKLLPGVTKKTEENKQVLSFLNSLLDQSS